MPAQNLRNLVKKGKDSQVQSLVLFTRETKWMSQ